jgi:hypothetical protein
MFVLRNRGHRKAGRGGRNVAGTLRVPYADSRNSSSGTGYGTRSVPTILLRRTECAGYGVTVRKAQRLQCSVERLPIIERVDGGASK